MLYEERGPGYLSTMQPNGPHGESIRKNEQPSPGRIQFLPNLNKNLCLLQTTWSSDQGLCETLSKSFKKLKWEPKHERAAGTPTKTISLNQLCGKGGQSRGPPSSFDPSQPTGRINKYVPHLEIQIEKELTSVFMLDTGSEVNLIKET